MIVQIWGQIIEFSLNGIYQVFTNSPGGMLSAIVIEKGQFQRFLGFKAIDFLGFRFFSTPNP